MTATPERVPAGRVRHQALAEASYRVLFDGAADAILITDREARYLDANAAATALLGYSRDELRQMRVHDLVALGPEWAEAAFASFADAGSGSYELELRRKDGSLVPVESHATRVELAGDPIFMAVLRDLTEQRRLQAEQRAREERLRLVTDAIPVCIAYVDTTQRYRFNNRAYEEWFGRPRETVLGRHLREVLGDDAYAAVQPHVERALAGERVSFEATVPFRDGGTRHVQATYVPHVDEVGTVLGFYAMVSDLTQRKRAEDGLRFLAEASAALADSLDYQTTLRRVAELAVPAIADACVVDMLDEAGRLRRLAVQARKGVDASWAWEVGETPPRPDAPYGPAKVVRTGESEWIPEVTDAHLVAGARSPRHLELLRHAELGSHMMVPLRARGRILGTIQFLAGRAGRRFTAEDLALAEELGRRAAVAVDNARLYQEAQAALRVRDEFLGSVSHDLRTPLTSIKGRAQLLRRQARRGSALSPQALEEGLEAIDAVVNRMTMQVDELVDVARTGSGRGLELNRQPLDLVSLVRESVAEHQRGTSIHTIRAETPAKPLIGEWDAARIERVLSNLLSNAVRYSPGGGAITVRVRCDDDDAVIEVADQGLGIPAADLPRIFERFHRGSNVAGQISGAGIGLAGAKQIVEQHGGAISIASEESVGTTVTVRLPLGT